MDIPMRRDKEGRQFGQERRLVHRRLVEKLEEWGVMDDRCGRGWTGGRCGLEMEIIFPA